MSETVAPDWRPRTDKWLARSPSKYAGQPDRPVFIGACPRSGTTLLRVMLDNHPDLAIPHETHFVRPLWWGRVGFGDLRDAGARRRAAEAMIFTKGSRDGRLRGDTFTQEEAIERIAAAPPTLGSMVEAAFRLYAEDQGKPRWGDKRPSYSGFIAPLFQMFPDAVYINVVRDPRGSVASQLSMPWDPEDIRFAVALARWEGAIDRTDHFARKLRPDQFVDVRYENLVADPVAELERLCAFTGLDPAHIPTMVAREDQERLHGAVFDLVHQPVTTESVERWRERLTPGQVALVESVAGPYFERFGYRDSDIVGTPDPAEAAEVAKQRKLNRQEFREALREETLRRLRYRRPIAAVSPEA